MPSLIIVTWRDDAPGRPIKVGDAGEEEEEEEEDGEWKYGMCENY